MLKKNKFMMYMLIRARQYKFSFRSEIRRNEIQHCLYRKVEIDIFNLSKEN